MDFVALDFETANSKLSSPCAIGMVLVKNNNIVDKFYSLINPEDRFDEKNINIHGITALSVVEQNKFPDIWEKIGKLLCHYPVVAHNAAFEKNVIEKTAKKYKIPIPNITYYCTFELSKQNFGDLSKHTLDAVCDYLKIPIENHHNALDDALACANIMIQLIENDDFCLHAQYLGNRVESYSVHSNEAAANYFHGTPNYEKSHVDFDEVEDIEFKDNKFVITGDFEKYSRTELKDLITSLSGTVTKSVSKRTNFVIVGQLDTNVVGDADNVKSGKIIDAEKHRAAGTGIKIIDGDSFIKILESKTNK